MSGFYFFMVEMKPSGFALWHTVPLHTEKPCFMHRQVRFIKPPDDEAAPLHSAMKHFPLRFKYEALRFRGV